MYRSSTIVRNFLASLCVKYGMSRFSGMFLGRGFSLLGLLVAAGVVCGCQGGGDVRLDGASDSRLEAQTREWIERVQKCSEKGVKDAARLTKEIAPLEEKLTAARRESEAVEPRTKQRFAVARTSAGPRPADRMAADAWRNALDEKLATIAADGEAQKTQAEKKIIVISRQLDNAKRALDKARHYVRTPEQIASEAKRYKAFLAAVSRPGARQLEQRIDELDFVNVDVHEIVDRLAGHANIAVNWRALETAGAAFDRPVTYKSRNVKLGEALEKLFALAGGNHYAVTVASLDNVVVVSTLQDIKDSAMLHARTAAQVAASPYKANKNMIAERIDRLEFIEMEFSVVLDFVEALVERKVQIDWDALKRYDITADTPITIYLRKPAYGLMIRLLLDQAAGGKALLDVEVKKGNIIIKPLVWSPNSRIRAHTACFDEFGVRLAVGTHAAFSMATLFRPRRLALYSAVSARRKTSVPLSPSARDHPATPQLIVVF